MSSGEVTPQDISLQSNWLFVHGQKLRTEVLRHSPREKLPVDGEKLQQILALGRFPILDAIKNFNYPGADTTPSIFTVQLGNTTQSEGERNRVFTPAGYANGGINYRLDEIQPQFQPYWAALRLNGFRPEVRRTSGKSDGGTWLLLRQPTLTQVSEEWLGFMEPAALKMARKTINDPGDEAEELATFLTTTKKRQVYSKFRTAHEKVIDTSDEYYKNKNADAEERMAARSRWQVGSQLSLVALKQTLELDDFIQDDIEDALTYAENSEFIDDMTVLAIENALY